MSDIHTVGLDLFSFSDNGMRKPVSRITLYVNNEDDQVYTAGDDTGLELAATCIYATEEMAKTLLSMAKGAQYQMYEAQAANLDPAAELGDGIEVGGITSVIAQINDNGDGYPDVSASGEQEVEDEYPGASRQGPIQRELSRARSLISKTNDRISMEIYGENGKGGLNGKMATFTMSLSSISGQIEGYKDTVTGYEKQIAAYRLELDGYYGKVSKYTETVNGYTEQVNSYKGTVEGYERTVAQYSKNVEGYKSEYSTISQTFKGIKLEATNDDGTVSIQLKSGDTALGTPGTIDLTGLVTFTALADGPDDSSGQTIINGGWIGTKTLQGKKIKGATYYDEKEVGRLRLAVVVDNDTEENYPWLIFDAENQKKQAKQLFSVAPDVADYSDVVMTMLDVVVLSVSESGVVHPTKAWNMSAVNMVASSKNYGEDDPPDDAVNGQIYFKLIS